MHAVVEKSSMQFHWAQKRLCGQLFKVPLSSGKESPVTIRYEDGWAGGKRKYKSVGNEFWSSET